VRYSARSFSKEDLTCACVKFSDNLLGKSVGGMIKPNDFINDLIIPLPVV
jgi:hypothetical protein